MKIKLSTISQVASLSMFLVAGASYAANNAINARSAAVFGTSAVNTGVLTPALLGGISVNGQVTHPNVFVFPAENQRWFTTVRTCFNPSTPFAGQSLNIPFPTELISSLTLGTAFSTPITGFVGPTLTAGVITGGLFNILAGLTAPAALTSVTVNYNVYDDAGVSQGTYTTSIPAFGCDTHTSDVTSDPLFLHVSPGLYTVVADAPILESATTLHIGFLTGSSNSTSRELLKELNIAPKSN